MNNDGDTLEDLDIKNGTILDLVPNMTLFVEKPDGTTITLKQIKSTDTVKSVKFKIKNMTGIPTADQKLYYRNKELTNPNTTLQEHGIKDKDTLVLDDGGMIVNIKNVDDGTTIPLKVKPDDTVEDIKRHIQDKIGMPIKEQYLSHKGKDITDDDDDTMKELGITNGDTIELEGMKINVKTPDGKVVPVRVKPTDTVPDLKKKIKAKTGVPPNDQVLNYKGKELDDVDPDDTLDDIGMKHGDTVNMAMTVNVRKPDGTILTIETSPEDTVDDIKRKVKKQTNIPMDDQRLSYKGVELDDPDDTMQVCGIQHGDTIDLSTDIEIKVKTLDGKLVPIVISPNGNILDVKKQVMDKEGIPVKQQRLYIDDPNDDDEEEELHDKSTLKKNGIKHGDVLHLGPMKVNVNMPDGGTIVLHVTPDDTIKDVKKKIKKQEGIPVDDQFLFFDGDQLEDNDATLTESGIRHGDTLDLTGMKITVTNPHDGSKIPLDVSPNDTIGDVKNKLADKTGMPATGIRLVLDEKDLDDDKATLVGLGIKYGTNLDLGGMQITISCPGGRYLPLPCKASDTLQEIKQRIENHVFIPVGIQRLLLQDKLLEDNDMTLAEYGIVNGTLLDLRGMIIHVNFAAKNRKFSIEVIPTWSILDVKKEVATQAPDDIPDRDLMKLLKDNTKELTNKPNLKYYKIEHQDILELELIPTYNVEMSSWKSPIGYKTKDKIKRDGVRARNRPSLANLMDSP